MSDSCSCKGVGIKLHGGFLNTAFKSSTPFIIMEISEEIKAKWKEYKNVYICSNCGKDYGSDYKFRNDNGLCHSCDYHLKNRERK